MALWGTHGRSHGSICLFVNPPKKMKTSLMLLLLHLFESRSSYNVSRTNETTSIVVSQTIRTKNIGHRCTGTMTFAISLLCRVDAWMTISTFPYYYIQSISVRVSVIIVVLIILITILSSVFFSQS